MISIKYDFMLMIYAIYLLVKVKPKAAFFITDHYLKAIEP